MSNESDEDKVRRYTENLKAGNEPKRALKRLYDLNVSARVFQEVETRKYVKRYLENPEIGKYAARLKQKLKNLEKQLIAERKRQRVSSETADDETVETSCRMDSAPEKKQIKIEPMSSHELFAKAIADQKSSPIDDNREKVKPDYSKFKVSKKKVEVKKEPKEEPLELEDFSGPSSSTWNNQPRGAEMKTLPPKNYVPSSVPVRSSSAPKPNEINRRQGANISERVEVSGGGTYDENMFKPRKERLKVFAGRKKKVTEGMESLLTMCQNVLAANVNAIGYVGWAPFDLLLPALKRCNIDQLRRILDINPKLAEDADVLFHDMIIREFPKYGTRKKEAGADWTWRELYDRLVSKKDKKEKDKLEMLTNRIGKGTQSVERRTMVIDSAHTNVKRRTGTIIPQASGSHMTATPSASELSKARKNIKTEGKSHLNQIQAPIRRAIQVSKPAEKKKAAPLMAKVRKMLKR